MIGQVMTIDWKRILGLGFSLAAQQNKAFKDGDMSVKIGTSQVIGLIVQKNCR